MAEKRKQYTKSFSVFLFKLLAQPGYISIRCVFGSVRTQAKCPTASWMAAKCFHHKDFTAHVWTLSNGGRY